MPNKKGAGRPVTIDVKNNHKQYFREYYHKSNADHYCEGCGQYVKLNSIRRHLLTKKHEYLLKKKSEENGNLIILDDKAINMKSYGLSEQGINIGELIEAINESEEI